MDPVSGRDCQLAFAIREAADFVIAMHRGRIITQGPTYEISLCRSRFEMSGPKLLFQLDFTAAAEHRKMPSA
jgi:hypothetical protein